MSELHDIIKNGKLLEIEHFLNTRVYNINVKDKYGCSPLHYAALNGYVNIVELLLSKDAALVSDNKGRTPLHYAAGPGHVDIIKLFFKYGAVLASNIEGRTPMHVASANGHVNIVEFFLSTDAALVNDNKGRTPFHYAALNGHVNIVELLLSKNEALVSDNKGRTPLHYAVVPGHVEVIKLLLSNRVAINAQDFQGNTPLHYAKNPKIIHQLINKGADITIENLSGKKALEIRFNQYKEYLGQKLQEINQKIQMLDSSILGKRAHKTNKDDSNLPNVKILKLESDDGDLVQADLIDLEDQMNTLTMIKSTITKTENKDDDAINLSHGGSGKITLLAEYSHSLDHKTNINAIITKINSNEITPSSVIMLERPSHGYLSMEMVKAIAQMIKTNGDLSEAIINSNIYADAVLYDLARSNQIKVIGLGDMNLPKQYDSNYLKLRDQQIKNQLSKITQSGYDVIFSVGSSHIDSLKALKNSQEQKASPLNIAIANGHLIAHTMIIPGIKCLTDKIDGNNDNDYYCTEYYNNAHGSYGKFLIKSAVANLVYGFYHMQGNNLAINPGINIANAIVASKLASDAAGIILEGTFSFKFDGSLYLQDTLHYIATMVTNSILLTKEASFFSIILMETSPALLKFTEALFSSNSQTQGDNKQIVDEIIIDFSAMNLAGEQDNLLDL